MTKTRKWIDARIDQLDPEVDYAEIIALSALYRANDFQLAWFFAVGTPQAGINPAGLNAVWKAGDSITGKQPAKRRDDSSDHLLTWFERGPDHEATKISIDMINKYHAHDVIKYSGALDNPAEYIYIFCLNATLPHILMQTAGLKGFTDKQKRATQIFWKKIAVHFTLPADQKSILDHIDFPETFDDMVAYVKDWQARDWPFAEHGNDYTVATYNFFADSFFPKPLRWFGQALCTSFYPDCVIENHQIKRPNVMIRAMAKGFMRFAITMADRVAPDPQQTILELRREAAAKRGEEISGVDGIVHHRLAQKGLGACPFHKPSPEQSNNMVAE